MGKCDIVWMFDLARGPGKMVIFVRGRLTAWSVSFHKANLASDMINVSKFTRTWVYADSRKTYRDICDHY